MRRVVILGSTGSIGRQALDVVAAVPGLRVVGLAAHTDVSGAARAGGGVRRAGGRAER